MKEPRKDKDIIKTPALKVSHANTLPPGLDEGGYEGDTISISLLSDSFNDTNTLDPTKSGPIGILPADAPPPPKHDVEAAYDITVKSQTLRVLDNGTYVVDVVLEFTSIEGAKKYEVRFAR